MSENLIAFIKLELSTQLLQRGQAKLAINIEYENARKINETIAIYRVELTRNDVNKLEFSL